MQLDRKSLASFRVLVAVARADRSLKAEEIEALKIALGPHVDLLDSLLDEVVDVDAEIALLDEEARKAVYQSAYALAYADGNASFDEVKLMKRLVPNEGERTFLGQVVGETLDTLLPERVVAEIDPARRDLEISEDIVKYSVLSAVAGAMPVPGVAIVSDLAVVAIQAKLVHDIGLYWGYSMDRHQVRAFVGSVAGSAAVRIAATNLAKFSLGWGSAFEPPPRLPRPTGSGGPRSSTARGKEVDEDGALADLFRTAKVEGEKKFEDEQERITTAEVRVRQAPGRAQRAAGQRRFSREEFNSVGHRAAAPGRDTAATEGTHGRVTIGVEVMMSVRMLPLTVALWFPLVGCAPGRGRRPCRRPPRPTWTKAGARRRGSVVVTKSAPSTASATASGAGPCRARRTTRCPRSSRGGTLTSAPGAPGPTR
ncbi:MAG: hypothetical protein R3F59_36060 [Myxococcota bacterium]